MHYLRKARTLANFINTNYEIAAHTTIPSRAYNHIGCLLADTVLQSGLNYKTVVLPRVKRIAEKYPEAKTISVFTTLVETVGAENILNWRHFEKPQRLISLLGLINSEGIETVNELSHWILIEKNEEKIMRIKGIGHKTKDYMKMLAGVPEIPIDRHLRRLVIEANIETSSYEEIHSIFINAADLLGLNRSALDWIIWDSRKKS